MVTTTVWPPNPFTTFTLGTLTRREINFFQLGLNRVVPQACPERPDLATALAGGVEILALCEWRLAIAGVGAARLALLVGVDAMSISECHAMSWSMAWHGMACRSVSRHQRYVCNFIMLTIEVYIFIY